MERTKGKLFTWKLELKASQTHLVCFWNPSRSYSLSELCFRIFLHAIIMEFYDAFTAVVILSASNQKIILKLYSLII